MSIPDSGVTRSASGATCGALPRPSAEACAARRERLAATLGSDALVLPGGELCTRSNDTEFRFRPDSDFYYLTGLAEPGALMVLRPGHDPTYTLFVRPRDRDAEVWSGRRIGPEGATAAFGADAAHPVTAIANELPKLLDGAPRVHVPLAMPDATIERTVRRAIENLRRGNRTGKAPPASLVNARVTLGEDRIVKDAAALASLRHAVNVTVDAHLEMAAQLRPGLNEYEVEAALEYAFRRRGASGPGYGTICGTGDNATILHYVDNDTVLRDGELLLVDAGAEWDLHSGDLTRTYPVSGRFTPAQRALYDIVLAANRAGIDKAVVGSDIDAIHDAALRVLLQGMLDVGLLSGTVDTLIEDEDEAYKRYYPHRTSHWLGADVHDAGYYCVDRKPRPLQPGFVLTVEPGIYVAADEEDAPPEFRGIGIRIEDDVLITDAGPEVLTHRAPKDPDAVEAIIGT